MDFLKRKVLGDGGAPAASSYAKGTTNDLSLTPAAFTIERGQPAGWGGAAGDV